MPGKITSVMALSGENYIGRYANVARLKLLDSIVIPSITVNIESWPEITKKEMKQIEVIQGKALKRMFSMPKSTPYIGLLLETGVMPMNARLSYKKMMLFHNIINSDKERIIKKIVEYQKEENRRGSWYKQLSEIAAKYEIDLTEARKDRKEKWKVKVKEKIKIKTQNELEITANKMSKLRTVAEEEHTMKGYLKILKPEETTMIMKIRLNMIMVSKNYQHQNKYCACPACGNEDDTTEHMYECEAFKSLRDIWQVKWEDIKSNDKQKLANIVKYTNAAFKIREVMCCQID